MNDKSSPNDVELDCPICLTIYYEPVTLYCGHSFCKSCIINHSFETHGNHCPVCRKIVSPYVAKYERSIQLEDCIKKLKPLEYSLKAETLKNQETIFSMTTNPSRIKLLKRELLFWYVHVKYYATRLLKLYPLLALVFFICLVLKFKWEFHAKAGKTCSLAAFISTLGKLKEALTQTNQNQIDVRQMVVSRFLKYMFTQYFKLVMN